MFKSQTVSCFVLNGGLTWNFNLGGAPWWGEFWERLVRMIKKCLKKAIGSERLSVTELSTVLFEIHWSDPREQNSSHSKDTFNEKINMQDNSKRTSRPRRDAAVAGKLHRRLNDIGADP